MEIAMLQLFIAAKASGGNQLKSPISRFMCELVSLRLLLLYYNTTDASQGLEACWESEQHRGLCC